MGRRTTADRDAAHALGKGLKSMFRSLEKRPAPDRLSQLVDELDAEPLKKTKAS